MTGKKGRILCVDDEPHVVRALQWLLQKEFEVHTASTAADGLRLLSQHDFDVVLSDQRMPGVTGVDFLREVRKASPRTMRILLTGYSDLDAMVRSVNESEVYRFVTKPWDIRELPRLVAEAAQVSRQAPVPESEPAPPDPAGAVADHRPTVVAMRAHESVLLIDDDAGIRETLLEALGTPASVRQVTNVAAAVQALDESPASIVVSDVRVGNVDVTRLIRLMKKRHPEVVAVVFSGVQDAQLVMDLINQGQVYRFLPKPPKVGFLRLVLDSALKRHRLLAASPEARRRFQAEPTGEDVSRSLQQDVERVAFAMPAGSAPVSAAGPAEGGGGAGLLERISGGFRRLFGA